MDPSAWLLLVGLLHHCGLSGTERSWRLRMDHRPDLDGQLFRIISAESCEVILSITMPMYPKEKKRHEYSEPLCSASLALYLPRLLLQHSYLSVYGA